MATFQDWDYFTRNVQSGLTEGQFLNSGGCLLAAGPPYLTSPVGGADDDGSGSQHVYPIGLVSQWQISHSLTAIPVPEAGSYRRYTITGPADGNFSMGRTLYHGPSLLRVLYAYYDTGENALPGSTPIRSLTRKSDANGLRNPKNFIADAPGYDNWWVNLASDLFTQPVGLLLYIKDVNREAYGATYLEQLQVVNHGFGSGPGQVAIAENASFFLSRARPVKLNGAIPLMSRHGDEGYATVAGTENTTGPNGPTRVPVATGSTL